MVESSTTTMRVGEHTVLLKTGPTSISCDCGGVGFCDHMVRAVLETTGDADVQAFIRTLPKSITSFFAQYHEANNKSERARLVEEIGHAISMYKLLSE